MRSWSKRPKKGSWVGANVAERELHGYVSELSCIVKRSSLENSNRAVTTRTRRLDAEVGRSRPSSEGYRQPVGRDRRVAAGEKRGVEPDGATRTTTTKRILAWRLLPYPVRLPLERNKTTRKTERPARTDFPNGQVAFDQNSVCTVTPKKRSSFLGAQRMTPPPKVLRLVA